MPPALEGRVVAITGASSGIGEATALALAGAGAAVALGARRGDRIEALAQRIEGDGGRAVAIEADVGDEDQARAFVERAHSELGGLHGLVNNAGVMLLGPVEGADTEEWRRMVHVNILGLLYCTHAAIGPIRDSGGGDIVNVSSVAGRHANAGAGVYNFTKFGVTGFSEALRQEVAALEHPGHVRGAGLRGDRAAGAQQEPGGAAGRQPDARADRRRAPGRRHRRARSSTRSRSRRT